MNFTDVSLNLFWPDGDPVRYLGCRDSDNGGAFDGEEDPTRDGSGEGETDANDPSDDMFTNIDVDGDACVTVKKIKT